ncbi:MAG: hypothetical protein HZA05_06900 [Nitrospirae bacterium]|nr:hypothetical protein [Nitrospirota bacterium]
MGEKNFFQPLTKEDKISVVLYRTGIVTSAILISIIAYMLFNASHYQADAAISFKVNIMLILLYTSVGTSVFFIHLYISKFHKFLKRLYYISLVSLIVFFVIGKGDIMWILVNKTYLLLLLIPLSGCLGFITAKEAFCFKLMEGYLLTLIMPLYLLLLSTGAMTIKSASYWIFFIAAMLILFTARKVFMPIHYDIGDKSAYQ